MKKLLSLVMIIMMGLTLNSPVFAAAVPSLDSKELALYIGSPLAISDGVIKALDSENPNVAPMIYNSRTLVPLRAISENFGAAVSYDAVKRAAIISFGGREYTFYVDKNSYSVKAADGKVTFKTLDTKTLIVESRTMVPLRVICEEVLGKSVGYSESMILVGVQAATFAANTALKTEIRTKIGQAVKITSLSQLKSIVAAKTDIYGPAIRAQEIANTPTDTTQGGAVEPTPAPVAPNTSNEAKGSDKASSDFSTTNNQVAGIDEADIVKTDGKFIYFTANGIVRIVKADAGKMTLADSIKMPVDPRTGLSISISELYIDQGRLVVLGSLWRGDIGVTPDPIMPMAEKSIGIYPPIWQGKSYVYCGVYAIDLNGKSELIKELELEGSMLSSRKSGDTVYITANKYFNFYYPMYSTGGFTKPASGNGIDTGSILPTYRDTAKSDAYNTLGISKIMYYPGSPSPQYLIVAALDIRDKSQEASIEAILGSGSTIYMDDSALYVAQTDYNAFQGQMTAITKFTIDGLKIGYAGGGKVKGTLLNQFSMDAFEGNLRVATTSWDLQSTNGVYILDKDLNQIGAVENLAPGERIFAVRFMADKGYLVTFRQIDPLFVLDLSDPKMPRVTGELKVPGFSNYLYPVAENLLMGIGQDTEDIYTKDSSGNEVVIGTRQTGIKFSLFDVSDQGKPKEIQKYVLGGSGSYSDILSNHKAIMFNLKENKLAFEASLTDNATDGKTINPQYFNGAVVMSFDVASGFKLEGKLEADPLIQIGSPMEFFGYVRRLCYIGDVLYYIQDGQIRSFNMDTLEPISVLK